MDLLLILMLGPMGQVGYWDGPFNLSQLNSWTSDLNPTISFDGLQLRWSSWRRDIPGHPQGGYLEASRPDRHSPFGAPTAVSGPLPGDGFILPSRTLAYSSVYWQALPAILEFLRASPAGPWGPGAPVPALLGPHRDQSVSGTADGLRLVFSRWGSLDPEIYESERPDLQSPWSPPIAQGRLNSPVSEREVGLSADGLTVLITRPSYNYRNTLFVSRRRSRAEPWSPPALIQELNDPWYYSAQPSLFADGRELFFQSDRIGWGYDDLWVARWIGLSHENLPQVGRPLLLHVRRPASAGRDFQFGLALSSAPGLPVPGVGTIPLAPDPLLFLSTSGQAPELFQGFRGVLDLNGEATASVNLPAEPTLAGLAFSAAAVLLGPGGVEFITNGEDLRVHP